MGRYNTTLWCSDATFQTLFLLGYQIPGTGKGEMAHGLRWLGCGWISLQWKQEYLLRDTQPKAKPCHLDEVYFINWQIPCSSQQNKQPNQVHFALLCGWFSSWVVIGFSHYRNCGQVKNKSSRFQLCISLLCFIQCAVLEKETQEFMKNSFRERKILQEVSFAFTKRLFKNNSK